MGLKASIMDPGRCMERVFGLIEVRRVHTWAVPFPEVPRYILEPWDCGKGGGRILSSLSRTPCCLAHHLANNLTGLLPLCSKPISTLSSEE